MQPPTRSTDRPGSLHADGLAQTVDSIDSCTCPPRTVVTVRPVALPFECTPANNAGRLSATSFRIIDLQHMSAPPAAMHDWPGSGDPSGGSCDPQSGAHRSSMCL